MKTLDNQFFTNQTTNRVGMGMVTSEQLTCGWQGKTRQECLTWLHDNGHSVIQFAHWLAIPKLHVLLTFHKQVCVDEMSVSLTL